MRVWSFYDLQTGLLTGQVFTGSWRLLEPNTPAGCGAVEGHHDHLSKKVHLPTGEVHEHVPPAPDPDHEWDETTKRWTIKPAVEAEAFRRRRIIAQIELLEAKQPRALRELALGHQGAQDLLRKLDLEIASLRESLT